MAGALRKYAERVRSAGRYGDTELVHVSRSELEAMRRAWGEPTINPETGLPEHFWGNVLSAVLPIAADYAFAEFIPEIASYLGVGEGLVRGVGGAGIGALASYLGGDDPLVGGALGAASGYFAPQALESVGLGGTQPPKYDSIDQLLSALTKDGTLTSGGGLGKVASSSGSLVGPMLAAAGLLTAGGSKNQQTSAVPLPGQNNSGYKLPQYQPFRQQVEQVNPDYTKPGNRDYFKEIPVNAARGTHVQGQGSGRDDSIPAMLSDGEYVIDAETVSLLGDGSNEEGARRLDSMRKGLRRHKGQALQKGNFSPNAKPPEGYMSRRAA